MNEKRFLNNLFNFLDIDSGETLDELKAELKEDGIDFDLAQNNLKNMLKGMGTICVDCKKPRANQYNSINCCSCGNYL